MTTTTTAALLSTTAATFGDDMKAFRSASVTGENKGNQAARSLLAALVSGVATPALATARIIEAFGNPKGKKGKPIDKLSGLRNVTGGDAARKMAEAVFRIFENIDADSVIVGEGDAATGGAIRPLVTAYILNEKDAPKSLRALVEGVNSALRAYAKATATDEGNATDEEGEEAASDAAPSQSLTDRALALMVAFEAATDADKVAAYDALNALFDMVGEDAVIAAHAATVHPEALAA